jgi:putative CocE/NonD family hydrolase
MKNDRNALAKLPRRCRLYTSGNNAWHELDQYPPAQALDTAFYLSSSGQANSLFGDGRLLLSPAPQSSRDRLIANAELPVPAVAVGCDARDGETRHDVLVYTSAVLDSDLTVLGPVRASIYIVADVPDCDVIVRVEDVHPDGKSVNMTGEFGCGPFRARYREGFEKEVMLTPGVPALLAFHVCHMGHCFRKGHRIRVALTATVANMLEPNHHTGAPVATALERKPAVYSVLHGPQFLSSVILPAVG